MNHNPRCDPGIPLLVGKVLVSKKKKTCVLKYKINS